MAGARWDLVSRLCRGIAAAAVTSAESMSAHADYQYQYRHEQLLRSQRHAGRFANMRGATAVSERTMLGSRPVRGEMLNVSQRDFANAPHNRENRSRANPRE